MGCNLVRLWFSYRMVVKISSRTSVPPKILSTPPGVANKIDQVNHELNQTSWFTCLWYVSVYTAKLLFQQSLRSAVTTW